MSDIKKINYELFERTITTLKELHKNMEDSKNKLKETNASLIDEGAWKGTSRNYYADIDVSQQAALDKINSSLEQYIKNLEDTLKNFDELDFEISNKIEG